MRGLRSNRWRHILFPQVGGRVVERRPWVERRLPFLVWCYYALAAWTTPRCAAVGFVGILPMAWLFALSIENNVTFFGFAVATLLLLGLAAGGALRPRLELAQETPPRAESGGPFTIRVRVGNRGRRTLHDLAVETLPPVNWYELRIPGARIAVLPPGEACTVDVRGRALRRGLYLLPPLRCDSDFPLGLWRWGRTDWTERRLSVYPRHARLTALSLPEGARNRVDLQEARQLARSALEFHGCREFRTGDPVRHVHARSSARLGFPVVKEFQAEGRGRTAIVADTWRRGVGVRSMRRVEAVLSVAASLADFLARSDRVLELLVAGPGVYRFVSAGRTGFLEEVLDILAAVEACASDPLPRLAPLLVREIRSIQSVCLVLGGWDARRAEFVRSLQDHGVGVKLVLVASGSGGCPPVPGVPEPPPDAVCLDCSAVLRGEVGAL